MTTARSAGRTSNDEVITEALGAHGVELRRFVAARVPVAEVDDILQSAAMRAVERSGSLNDPERVLAWLYRIHRNIIADTLRKRATRERLLDRDVDPPAETATVEPQDSCDCSIAQTQRLRPTYGEVLTLIDVRGVSIAEAAKILGISTNNATVRLHRARKALRTTMLNHCGVESARDCIDCRCVFDGCCPV